MKTIKAEIGKIQKDGRCVMYITVGDNARTYCLRHELAEHIVEQFNSINTSPTPDAEGEWREAYTRVWESINDMFAKHADSGERWCDLCGSYLVSDKNAHKDDCIVGMALRDLQIVRDHNWKDGQGVVRPLLECCKEFFEYAVEQYSPDSIHDEALGKFAKSFTQLEHQLAEQSVEELAEQACVSLGLTARQPVLEFEIKPIVPFPPYIEPDLDDRGLVHFGIRLKGSWYWKKVNEDTAEQLADAIAKSLDRKAVFPKEVQDGK